MATKQINQLTAATAIEDADSIPLQTLGGVTKKFTPVELKADLDGRYQQFGEVIWEDTPATNAILVNPIVAGKIYAVYVQMSTGVIYNGQQIIYGRAYTDSGNTILSMFYVYYNNNLTQITNGNIYYELDIDDISSINATTDIYKIVEYTDVEA